jgi:hypothetical protein
MHCTAILIYYCTGRDYQLSIHSIFFSDVRFPYVIAEFLRHAPCIRDVRQDFGVCARDYEEKLQTINAKANESLLPAAANSEEQMRALCW